MHDAMQVPGNGNRRSLVVGPARRSHTTGGDKQRTNTVSARFFHDLRNSSVAFLTILKEWALTVCRGHPL